MIENNKLENIIKNYLFEVSGIHVNVTDNIVEMGLLQSMDFIMFINFLNKYTKLELTQDELNVKNFNTISTILLLLDQKQQEKNL